MKSKGYALGIAALAAVVAAPSAAWALCAIGGFGGEVGSIGSLGNPPATFIVGIVANGTGTITVYNSDNTAGVINFGANSGITATGSWTAVAPQFHALSVNMSGNTMSINGSPVITFTGVNWQNTTIGWNGGQPGAGLSRISAGTNTIGFSGWNTTTNSQSGGAIGFDNPCVLNTAATGSAGMIQLSATGSTELASVEFFVDSVSVGVDNTAPFSLQFDSTGLYNGGHTYTATATFAGSGQLSKSVTLVTANSVLSAGNSHNCVMIAGAAKCWGANSYGQLGNGSTSPSNGPVQVNGLSSGVTGVSGGGIHSCAVVNGAAKCWGSNGYGQLGDGTTTDSSVPVQVSGLTSGVTAIVAAQSHTCAIVNGGVKCWGRGADGRLGHGSFSDSLFPVQVNGLGSGSGVIAVDANNAHTCAIVGTAMKCWGDNTYGQLGNMLTTDSNVPVWVTSLASVTSIGVGSISTCAISLGAAKCWGNSTWGQVGTGSTATINLNPTTINGGALSRSVTGGSQTHCALIGTTTRCWGLNNYGQVGDGTTTNATTPKIVVGMASGGVWIATGTQHSCNYSSGEFSCWGRNDQGQLGDATFVDSLNPVLVSGI